MNDGSNGKVLVYINICKEGYEKPDIHNIKPLLSMGSLIWWSKKLHPLNILNLGDVVTYCNDYKDLIRLGVIFEYNTPNNSDKTRMIENSLNIGKKISSMLPGLEMILMRYDLTDLDEITKEKYHNAGIYHFIEGHKLEDFGRLIDNLVVELSDL